MFHYNPPILQQQQVQFTTQSQQQSNSQRNNQNQQRNKLSNISSPTFDIYGVQDPTFLVADNSTVHHEQVYSQQQQQFQSLSDRSSQREQTRISQAPQRSTLQPYQTETTQPGTQSSFDNSNQMIEYLDTNHSRWSNQQFVDIQGPLQNNLTIESEEESLSSGNSSPTLRPKAKKVKRPMNAFMVFSVKRRKELSSRNPTLTTSEISTILGDEWTGMSIEEKNEYILKAQMIKDNFDREHPDYVYTRRPNNSRKKRSVENTIPESYPPQTGYPPQAGYPMNPPPYMYPYPYGPYPYPPPPPPMSYGYAPIQIKQSPNAFILFSAEVRPKVKAENPDSSVGEISRLVGDAWKKLPEEEKSKYIEESKRLRKENNDLKKLAKAQQKSLKNKMPPSSMYLPYGQPMKPSSPSYGYPYPPTGMPSYSISPPAKRLRTPKDPTQPKHPSSAFLFYLRDVRPQYVAKYPKKSLGVISKMISAAWKALSAEEKARYISKSDEDKKRYILEMEMWLENNKRQKNNED